MTEWVDYASRIEEPFAASSAALLVVDVQHWFCAPDGRTGKKHANLSMQRLPAQINDFTRYFESIGGTVIYLKSTPDEASISDNERWLNKLKNHSRPASPNALELQLYGLDLRSDSLIVEKTGDGFTNSNLNTILRNKGTELVLVCGVRTEICVRRVAERASAEDYLVFVLRDLCATRDNCAEHADQALMFLNAYTSVVLDSDRVRDLLTASNPQLV